MKLYVVLGVQAAIKRQGRPRRNSRQFLYQSSYVSIQKKAPCWRQWEKGIWYSMLQSVRIRELCVRHGQVDGLSRGGGEGHRFGRGLDFAGFVCLHIYLVVCYSHFWHFFLFLS